MRKLKNTELNRKSVDEFKKSKKTSAIVILDNIGVSIMLVQFLEHLTLF